MKNGSFVWPASAGKRVLAVLVAASALVSCTSAGDGAAPGASSPATTSVVEVPPPPDEGVTVAIEVTPGDIRDIETTCGRACAVTEEKLRVECVWSDGVDDPACNRAGTPTWTVDGLGGLRSAEGPIVWWENPDASTGEGIVRVSYGGASAEVPVERAPVQVLDAAAGTTNIPFGFFSPAIYPDATDAQRQEWGFANLADIDAFATRQNEQAQAISDGLEDYIRRWFDGEAPAELPEDLLPYSLDNYKTGRWRLVPFDEIDPARQWISRPAQTLDPGAKGLPILGSDSHVTYLKAMYIAPFGATLHASGEFPHARFFDFQISQPFDPTFPIDQGFGNGEIPIADVDIDPLDGHTNPYRVGEDRDATERSYEVTFEMAAGSPVEMNPGYAPGYRWPGNNRVGGPFVQTGAVGQGMISPANLWGRLYAPDDPDDPFGGVELPTLWFELDGQRFWIEMGTADRLQAIQSTTAPATPGAPVEPTAARVDGWIKQFDLVGRFLEERAAFMPNMTDQASEALLDLARTLPLVGYGRGPAARAPGSYESSATFVPYNSYLVKNVTLGQGQVLTLTGRLPTTPDTRRGGEDRAVMSAAQARYFSISSYWNTPDGYPAALQTSIMDDEIVTDSEGNYTIVYSRAEDRPANATAENGITWVEWGPAPRAELLLRWMTIAPDWSFDRSPDEHNLPWATTAYSQPGYAPDLLGRNDHTGFLGPFQPVSANLAAERFAALGSRPSEAAILDAAD